MRRLLVAGFCFLVSATSFAVVSPIRIGTGITFYSDGRPPTVYSPLRVGETTFVGIADTGNQQKSIVRMDLRNDSLLLYTAVAASGPVINIVPNRVDTVFEVSGLCRAFEISMDKLSQLSPLGIFRVLPVVRTTPSNPIAGENSQLELVMGLTHSACPLAYQSSVTIDGNRLVLHFTELALGMPCLAIYLDPPVEYGPTFDLGKLSAGDYQVVVEDSVIAATISVNQAVVLNGSAVAMQSPLWRMATRPVPGAEILAYPAPSCDRFLLTPGVSVSVSETLRTVTDNSGAFSLTLSSGDKYEICAVKSGYRPQTLYYETVSQSTSMQFELIPAAEADSAGLAITVTDKGVPVANATVVLYGGTSPIICPLLAKTAYQWVSHSGKTGQDGSLSFRSLPLSPYIDYVYVIQAATGLKTVEGSVRLNSYIANTLNVDLSSPAISANALLPSAGSRQLSMAANRAGIRIHWSGEQVPDRITISDVRGRIVHEQRDLVERTHFWNTEGHRTGVYVVSVRAGNRVESSRALVRIGR